MSRGKNARDARVDRIVRDHAREQKPRASSDRGRCSDADVLRALKGCQAALSGLSLRAKERVIAGLSAHIREPGEF